MKKEPALDSRGEHVTRNHLIGETPSSAVAPRRGCGVGRDLGVTLGLGVVDGVGVAEGVAVGLGVGVGVGVAAEMSSQVSLKNPLLS